MTTGIVCCILGVLGVGIGVAMANNQPNRIANGFVLAAGVLFICNGLGYIIIATQDYSSPLITVFVYVYYARFALYAILGFSLLINGVVTVRRCGVALTHVLPIAWGVLLLFDVYWYLVGPGQAVVGSELYVNVMTYLTVLIDYIPFALFATWLSNDVCYKSRKAPEHEFIIVLGCGIKKDGTVTPLLRGRLDAAIQAWKAGGEQAKIITSGGQGPDEVISEARSMANYLIEQGVPESSILLEDRSTTTEENLAYSQAIIAANGGASHCTIATSSYHTLRAAMFARRAGMNVSCVGGRTARFFYPAAFFREYVALIVRNRYAVVFFVLVAFVRFQLELNGVLPAGMLF